MVSWSHGEFLSFFGHGPSAVGRNRPAVQITEQQGPPDQNENPCIKLFTVQILGSHLLSLASTQISEPKEKKSPLNARKLSLPPPQRPNCTNQTVRMEDPCFVYETLAPLSTSADSNPDPSESYSVIRSHISAPSSLCPQTAAPDYFSLDSVPDSVPILDSPLPPSEPGPSSQEDPSLERAWFRADCRFKSPMLQLHKEIFDFCEFVSPTQEEQTQRAAAVQRVFEVVRYIWPHCQVEVFGSFKTGLYLPTSDIDVVILESKVRTPQIGLHALSRALSQRSIAKKIQVIAKARVPIIKFIEKGSGVAFDISFDVHNGPKAAEFIKDAVFKIPPLRPLCLILKVFLQQRELNEVYSGGIGSYALLTMLMAHLQMHWRGHDFKGYQTSPEHNLGILLVNFLDFYGRKLNTWDVGVSCKASGTLFSKTKKGFMKTERPFLLSIEDPQIRSAFSMAYSLLTDAKTIMALGPNRSILGTIIRPDPVLLERKGGCNGDMTFDILLPGSGQPLQRGDEDEIQCNWQLFDDEPLPREKVIIADDRALSRKRRALKPKHRGDALENGEATKIRNEEDVGRRDSGMKKQRRKGFIDAEDRYTGSSHRSNHGGWHPWHHSR
ncbi:poly(A) RNA polymerase protein 1 isoform X2 [Magnolia sinica]|uniref:poly(A) RNA polymerase protein 1 isoform X2 n=1 Tax=Magnolia sinica TaxID=86752 RepID=UPI0026589E78|nr:poly(A) RNA polymerase protein 1 isoform X2 [Magnolia sinica]